ncbi:MAG TPA: lytic transglycosylase domain-containing protein [Baekduia sp.]|uniref:lytic transglycosylase domain-containing protein n=1 Tax=Baekduia sp. TaxID=2600305 RepID=UPI002D77ADE0|nr:lytic transglycosylase domain-containing protein [Baekduia sp.]HET6509239.1 lytic transglycosylase domain-containing protein [Baekduia sp.]
MSTRTATSAPRRRPAATASSRRIADRRRREARMRRRRGLAILAAAGLALCAVLMLRPAFHHAVKEISLPLRHEDIIRQQARDKGLDPALIAGVIYAESHFIDGRTSSAGAEGLMQLTPATAHYIAQKSGGTAFRTSDLGTPQVNISYGAFYLRYLMRRYGNDVPLVLAAYNAGEGNVDKWIASARAKGKDLDIDAIPFGETRSYVTKVLDARKQYRSTYRHELGL